MLPLVDAFAFEPLKARPDALACIEPLTSTLYQEYWAIRPRSLLPDQVHQFISDFTALDEVIHTIKMHLYIVFDWIARDVFEWLLRLILVVSVQRQRLRGDRCRHLSCYIMPSDGPSILLDAMRRVLPVVGGIVEWSRSLVSILKPAGIYETSEHPCSFIHLWLVQVPVRQDLLAEVLGCPCLVGKNRLTSITLHLSISADEVPSPSPSPSCTKCSLPPLCLDDTPSRKRSVDMRTPSSSAFANPSAPERKRSRHTHGSGRRSSWTSSVGTLVGDADLSFVDDKEVGKPWDEEVCAGSASPSVPVCGNVQDTETPPYICVDDELVSVVDSDSEECEDDSDSGCCVSLCTRARSPVDEEDYSSAYSPSPSPDDASFDDACLVLDDSKDLPVCPAALTEPVPSLYDLDFSPTLPFWSRLFRLVFPWNTH